jgi:REP element-mobilizing transposase RayT
MVTATINKRMSRRKQPTLDNSIFKEPPKEFGGSLLKKSNPKMARPITTKKPMHIVMRSRIAKYDWSFLHYTKRKKIEEIIQKQARTFDIKIYKLAICYNHLHMLIKLQNRESFAKFIKSISGLIAKLVIGGEKGNKKGIKLWDSRPFSRIVEWIRDFLNAKEYVILNKKEAAGLIPYQPRKYRCAGT